MVAAHAALFLVASPSPSAWGEAPLAPCQRRSVPPFLPVDRRCRSPDTMEKYRQLSSGGLDEGQVSAALDAAGAGSPGMGKLIKVWHGMSLTEGVALVTAELVRR